MILITNEWTHAISGHAREELTIVKSLVQKAGRKVSIISNSSDFGDIQLPKLNLKTKYIPNRGPFFHLQKRINSRVFGQSLNKLLLEKYADHPLIFTSQHWNSSMEILTRITQTPLSVRYLSLPSTKKQSHIFNRFVRTEARNIKIVAVETTIQKARLEVMIGRHIEVVPPISGLSGPLVANRSTNRVGIFWPTAHPESIFNIKAILRSLQDFSLVVRLPRGIDERQLENLKYEKIPHDLSLEQFGKICQNIGVAVLPHRGYEIRGSSFASLFTGLGIPIIAIPDNAFFQDLKVFGLAFPFNLNTLGDSVINAYQLENEDRLERAIKYRDFLARAWSIFTKESLSN